MKKTISVIGYNNSITKIYRSNLISGIIFETTGITGITHAITWINFNKAIENVDNYILYNSIDQNSNEQLSKQ